MQKTLFLFLTAILFLNASCDKDDECLDCTVPIPETLSCDINGVLWVSESHINLSTNPPPGISVAYNPENGFFNLATSKRDLREEEYDEQIFLRGWEKENEPLSFKIGYSNSAFSNDLNEDACRNYELDTLSHIDVRITEIDSINERLKGTFEFTAINQSCQDTLVVTNGIFDSNFLN